MLIELGEEIYKTKKIW